MIFDIPNDKKIEINTIVLDLNGTLAVYGKVSKKIRKLIKKLKELNYRIVLLSGDVRGNAKKISKELDIELIVARSYEEKENAMDLIDSETCASIGNARIDIGTFRKSKIAIATLQNEGIHAEIIQYVDIIVPSIEDALYLFIDKDSLYGTMRK
jgi:soluble P-type ATPase